MLVWLLVFVKVYLFHKEVESFEAGLHLFKPKVTSKVSEELSVQKLIHDCQLDFGWKLFKQLSVMVFMDTEVLAVVPNVLHVSEHFFP